MNPTRFAVSLVLAAAVSSLRPDQLVTHVVIPNADPQLLSTVGK